MPKRITTPDWSWYDLNRMTLAELNEAIDKYGKRVNTRIARLEKYRGEGEKIKDTVLEIIYERAGVTTPSPNGKAPRFSRKKATDVNVARERLADILTVERYKTGTVQGLKEEVDERIHRMSVYFDMGRDLTKREFYDVLDVIHSFKGNEPEYSEAKAILRQEFKEGQRKFRNVADLNAFVADRAAKGKSAQMEYEQLQFGRTYHYNEKTGRLNLDRKR